ncbi:hypothetical protein L484_010384 [Morus notabilis]|uniref:Uncharacterized protein n=1 Tax=Morus notabilis TaxID=981085 RepID=W9S7I5_9ROSA|nr:hypothetical protein L484_010384 [Morus notabilis]
MEMHGSNQGNALDPMLQDNEKTNNAIAQQWCYTLSINKKKGVDFNVLLGLLSVWSVSFLRFPARANLLKSAFSQGLLLPLLNAYNIGQVKWVNILEQQETIELKNLKYSFKRQRV